MRITTIAIGTAMGMAMTVAGSAFAQETTAARTPAQFSSEVMWANHVSDAGCADENAVRATAQELDAREIVPLISRFGTKFLLMVFAGGDGLVVGEVRTGCFNSAAAVAADQVQAILVHSNAA